MRVGIFYFSLKNGEDRVPVLAGAGVFPIGYVRCEVLEDVNNLTDALDRANPRPDESVMNTHPIR